MTGELQIGSCGRGRGSTCAGVRYPSSLCMVLSVDFICGLYLWILSWLLWCFSHMLLFGVVSAPQVEGGGYSRVRTWTLLCRGCKTLHPISTGEVHLLTESCVARCVVAWDIIGAVTGDSMLWPGCGGLVLFLLSLAVVVHISGSGAAATLMWCAECNSTIL
jgi:hypothetical protein